MSSSVARFYSSLVFTKPYLVIAILLLFVGFFGWQAQNFRLDASADSLLLEDDPDLEFSREMGVRYGTSEAVTIAYTPKGDLFSREELNKLGALSDELLAISRVESVDSILNVPIFEDTPLTGISEDYLTLADQDIDLVAAREEVTSSPVFKNAVISPDGQTAGMLVSFSIDETARDLIGRRTELRNKARSEELSADQASELAQVEADYAVHSVLAADR